MMSALNSMRGDNSQELLYNDRLPKFRAAALAAMRGAVMNGYRDRTAEEREAIWAEFCRRAKATPEERKEAEGVRF